MEFEDEDEDEDEDDVQLRRQEVVHFFFCRPNHLVTLRAVLHFWQLLLLFGAGFAAGFVDSIAGGGGLITMPVLMSFKFDPLDALGTNKLQAAFGSGSAMWNYAEAGSVPLRDCRRCFLVTFIAAAIGTQLVQQLSRGFLEHFIPVLLLLIAVYAIFRPELGRTEAPARMRRPQFDVLFGLVLGFYDGFFGPGTGTFWAMAYVLALGFNFTKATAYTKVMNFASNLSSLLLFLIAGHVLALPGVTMGFGQLLGARVGSRTVVKHGARFIRPIFITVVLALTLYLIYNAYLKPSPSRS